MRPYIYVCSPYGGQKENYERALSYGRFVVSKGYIPIIPHTMLHGVLDDKNPTEREIGLDAGKGLIKQCEAVWVFGKDDTASIGMQGEIAAALEFGIPVVYIDGSRALDPNERSADISRCIRHYEQTYCGINRAVADSIIYYYDAGISADLICKCIDIAAKKQAHWNYSEAILTRCLNQSIFTVEQFEKKSSGGKPKASEKEWAAYDFEIFEKMLDANPDD